MSECSGENCHHPSCVEQRQRRLHGVAASDIEAALAQLPKVDVFTDKKKGRLYNFYVDKLKEIFDIPKTHLSDVQTIVIKHLDFEKRICYWGRIMRDMKLMGLKLTLPRAFTRPGPWGKKYF